MLCGVASGCSRKLKKDEVAEMGGWRAFSVWRDSAASYGQHKNGEGAAPCCQRSPKFELAAYRPGPIFRKTTGRPGRLAQAMAIVLRHVMCLFEI